MDQPPPLALGWGAWVGEWGGYLTGEQLRGHVDGGAHDAAGHHGLGLAEAQVCDLRPVLFVQLGGERRRRFTCRTHDTRKNTNND